MKAAVVTNECTHEFRPIDSSGQRVCIHCNERQESGGAVIMVHACSGDYYEAQGELFYKCARTFKSILTTETVYKLCPVCYRPVFAPRQLGKVEVRVVVQVRIDNHWFSNTVLKPSPGSIVKPEHP